MLYNHERHQALHKLIKSWQKGRPESPADLALAIEFKCSAIETYPVKPGMSAGAWNENSERLIRSLEKSIKALKEFSESDRMYLHQEVFLVADEDPRIKQSLTNELYDGFNFTKGEPTEELLTLFDVLSNAVKNHAETCRPDRYERPRMEIDMIRSAAEACREHGVTVGAASGGHFLSIIETILPEAKDARDLVRQALKLGKYTKKI